MDDRQVRPLRMGLPVGDGPVGSIPSPIHDPVVIRLHCCGGIPGRISFGRAMIRMDGGHCHFVRWARPWLETMQEG
jgi:hypothetical protein